MTNQQPSEPAGFTYAPDYDSQTELDPKRAESIADIKESPLEYVKAQQSRRSLAWRASITGLVLGMLTWNLWLTQRNYENSLINMDQTRIAQSDLEEATWTRIDAQRERLERIEAKLDELAKPLATGE